MLLDIKNNIDDYLMVYHYAVNNSIERVHHITIYHNGSVDIFGIMECVEGFVYEKLIGYTLNITSDEFKSFKRDYQIDLILSDIDPDVDLYALYISKLEKIKKSYYKCLKEYIPTLSIGTPIWYRDSLCHIHNFEKCKRNCVNLMRGDILLKNIPFNKLSVD